MSEVELKKVKSRDIKLPIQCMLWGMAGGRCQFKNCNRVVYENELTLEKINLAEKAHIYSFSERGPRGNDGLEDKNELNGLDNLLLVCERCHKTIDHNQGKKYPVYLLQKWKKDHEYRIKTVGGIDPKNKSYPVTYFSRIGSFLPKFEKGEALKAMFPGKYPTQEDPIDLSSKSGTDDSEEIHWMAEDKGLVRNFERKITSIIEDVSDAHFSVFALAPMPLLIRLGTLFSDINRLEIYQPIREPAGWNFEEMPEGFEFVLNKPETTLNRPVLVFSLSARVRKERVTSVLGDDIDIWEITVPDQFVHNDFIRSKEQITLFKQMVRKTISDIEELYPSQPLPVFPVMPASCAVAFGVCRQNKTPFPWVIYDQNNKAGGFMKTIEIGGEENG